MKLVEKLISDIIYSYNFLERLVNAPIEDYVINRGKLNSRLKVKLSLDIKLWELMDKSLFIKNRVGIIARGIEEVKCLSVGAIPTETEIDIHLKDSLDKWSSHHSYAVGMLDTNKKDLIFESKKRKEYLKSLLKCAKENDIEKLEKIIDSFYDSPKYSVEVSLNELRHTVEGLIELIGQVCYYTEGGFMLIDKLKESLDAIKVKSVWFEINEKKYTNPFNELVFPTGKLRQEVSIKLIAEEFMVQLKKDQKK